MNTRQTTYHPNHKKLARFAKALGHPARIAIMAHLSQAGGCCAGELQLNMPLAQSTVSQH
ncbi:MAG: ArsR family transcriptional regulator, partial [Candidatus Cyclonatronum sp.]|nr:ArsR family transcriptional regulator [Cyclonatronum sp.]